jgi:hypothetical protein
MACGAQRTAWPTDARYVFDKFVSLSAGRLCRADNLVETRITPQRIPAGIEAQVAVGGHAPTAASESAIVANLPPGNYTAIVRGVSNTTGVALVEVYDLNP